MAPVGRVLPHAVPQGGVRYQELELRVL